MDGLYGDCIPLDTIDLARATLPDPNTCSDWVRTVDVISQKGAHVTLEFERVEVGAFMNVLTYHWEAVYCYRN